VSDAVSGLSELEVAELCALADGTLPPERRAEVEARVAASPELLEVVERQRRAVDATRLLADDQPPASLIETVSDHTDRRSRTGRLIPRLALAAGLAAAVAVAATVVLIGGPGGPTVADAARLAGQTPNGPPPRPQGKGSQKLALAVEGVTFPNLAQWAGWEAVGARRGRIDGRAATVVFYEKGGRRIAYVIVAGSGLSRPSAGRTTNRRGVDFQVLRLNGRLAVTWRRGGHTCVLIGDATTAELLKLAGWPLSSPR
jgi:anti-sigma factor RsiW